MRLVCEVEEVRDEYKWGSEDGAEKERGRERESEGTVSKFNAFAYF